MGSRQYYFFVVQIMKARELREKSKEELRHLLVEKQGRLDELAALLHGRKVKNVKERALTRRDIARIKTLAREVDTAARSSVAPRS